MTANDPTVIELLRVADAICAHEGISKWQLGNRVVGDGKFFAKVARDGNPTIKTLRKFQTYFAEHGFAFQMDGGVRPPLAPRAPRHDGEVAA